MHVSTYLSAACATFHVGLRSIYTHTHSLNNSLHIRNVQDNHCHPLLRTLIPHFIIGTMLVNWPLHFVSYPCLYVTLHIVSHHLDIRTCTTDCGCYIEWILYDKLENGVQHLMGWCVVAVVIINNAETNVWRFSWSLIYEWSCFIRIGLFT